MGDGNIEEDEMIELTDCQAAAIEAARTFLVRNSSGVFRIGGLAGTGKTTVLSQLLDNVTGSIPCAFTGKAASVMRKKGIDGAKTIHSSIYRYDEKTDRFLKKSREELDGRWFAVDEASMVSAELWEDLQSFRLPIVLIGDHGQLEPVGNDVGLMKHLDFELKQIHRQSEGSEIIEFAHIVRTGKPFGRGTKGGVTIASASDFERSIGEYDHYLCGFNRTRCEVNRKIRRHIGNSGLVCHGERIIILTNDQPSGLFNGMVLTVNQAKPLRDVMDITATDELGDRYEFFAVKEFFGSATAPKPEDREQLKSLGAVAVDYGYCTSVHKFQGSEADSVAILDEQCDLWDARRWRYTAVTRAAKRVLFCGGVK